MGFTGVSMAVVAIAVLIVGIIMNPATGPSHMLVDATLAFAVLGVIIFGISRVSE